MNAVCIYMYIVIMFVCMYVYSLCVCREIIIQ